MLTLQSIKVYDHPVLDSLEIKFDLDNPRLDGAFMHRDKLYTTVKLVGGEYEAPVNEVGDILWMLSLLQNREIFPEFMKQYFEAVPTKIRVSYLDDGEQYFYALNISKQAIHSQIFIKETSPLFQTQEDSDSILMCEELDRFLRKIIFIDLSRNDEIEYMIESGQELCETQSFREFISTMLISLGVTADPLKYIGKQVMILDLGTNTYIPIEDANKTIRALFGICTTMTPSFQGGYLVVINDFMGIDTVKKAQIVSYFLSTGVNRESSQLLITDPEEYDGYGLVLEGKQKCKLMLNNSGKYEIVFNE